MLPDRVSNPGPLTYESGAIPIVLRGPAEIRRGNRDIPEIVFLFLNENICCEQSS